MYSYLSHKSFEFGVQLKNMPGILMHPFLNVSFETYTHKHIYTIRIKHYPSSSQQCGKNSNQMIKNFKNHIKAKATNII